MQKKGKHSYFQYEQLIIDNQFLESNTNSLKYISLITLTLQNALLGLSMRYARTRDGDMFLSSTGMYILC